MERTLIVQRKICCFFLHLGGGQLMGEAWLNFHSFENLVKGKTTESENSFLKLF